MDYTVNWIIEKDLFPEYENKLKNIILSSGNNVLMYDHNSIENKNIEKLKNKYSNNDIVVFYGSLKLGNKILKFTNLFPGLFLTIENYECYKYYGYFGDYLLNSDYRLIGLNDLLRNKDNIFPDSNNIFIRPSNGFKTFPGQIINKNNFEKEYNNLLKSYGGIDKDILILISPYKQIEKEWRFIVINGELISGSLYMDSNNREKLEPYYNILCENEYAYNFANKMVNIYQPDKAYTMDICRTTNNQYKLLELNSFNCASLYGNNYEKIVKSMNQLCIEEWKDVYKS